MSSKKTCLQTCKVVNGKCVFAGRVIGGISHCCGNVCKPCNKSKQLSKRNPAFTKIDQCPEDCLDNDYFKVETANAQTGSVTSGPFKVRGGDTLRFWSAGGIDASVTQGSALVNIEPNNILMTNGAPTTPPADPTRPVIYVDSTSGEIYTWNPDQESHSTPSSGGSGETGTIEGVISAGLCNGEDHLTIKPNDDASTNASVSVGPKGTGFISAQTPDNTSVGGNCRGNNSVDLQMKREFSDRVAAGNYGVIVGGEDNAIGSGNHCFIGGGDRNLITGGNEHSIVGGDNNRIIYGSQHTICGGDDNTITSGTESVIVGGGDNIITNSNCSTICGGEENEMTNYCYYSFIGGGIGNTMSIAEACCIVSGDDNKIGGNSDNSMIGSGNDNSMYKGGNSVICSGSNNEMNRTDGCGIVTGFNNKIQQTSILSMIGSGNDNTITESYGSFIGAGNDNTLTDDSRSFIGTGSDNFIEDSSRSFIGSGYNNNITGSNNVTIINGNDNKILKDSTHSIVLTGDSNTITGGNCIIGCGSSNTVNVTNTNAGCIIFDGSNNNISGNNTKNSSILNSDDCSITSAQEYSSVRYLSIIGSKECTIQSQYYHYTTEFSSIISGSNCTIDLDASSSTPEGRCVIIGGTACTITHDCNIMIGCDNLGSTAGNEIHLGKTTKLHQVATNTDLENILVWDSHEKEIKNRTKDSFGFLTGTQLEKEYTFGMTGSDFTNFIGTQTTSGPDGDGIYFEIGSNQPRSVELTETYNITSGTIFTLSRQTGNLNFNGNTMEEADGGEGITVQYFDGSTWQTLVYFEDHASASDAVYTSSETYSGADVGNVQLRLIQLSGSGPTNDSWVVTNFKFEVPETRFDNILSGTTFLENGTGTVGATGINTDSKIYVNHFEPETPANMGILYIDSLSTGTFTVKSTNSSDSNQINWMALNPNI